jgi:hypothetical protein
MHAKAVVYLYHVEGGVHPYISVLSFNVTAALCRDSARSLLINTRMSFMILRYVELSVTVLQDGSDIIKV